MNFLSNWTYPTDLKINISKAVRMTQILYKKKKALQLKTEKTFDS